SPTDPVPDSLPSSRTINVSFRCPLPGGSFVLFTFPFSDSDFQTPGDRADGVSSRQTQHLLTNPSPTLYLKCEYQTYSPTTLGGSISSRKREDHYPPVSPP